jgi:hypothetical protein
LKKKYLALLSASIALVAFAPVANAATNLDNVKNRITNNIRPIQSYQNIDQISNFVVPDSAYSGVGFLSIGTNIGNFSCTGSLIGPSLVLTASHCLSIPGVTITGVQFVLPGVFNQDGNIAGREIINSTGFVLHPDYDIDIGVSGGSDVAVVSLSNAASGLRNIYELYSDSDEINNLSYLKVGTGTIGTGTTGVFDPNLGEPRSSDGRKRYGYNEYEFFYSDVLELFGGGACVDRDVFFGAPCQGILAYDFDSGFAQNDVFGQFLGASNVGRRLNGRIVDAVGTFGDSGGPTFINGRIAGVSSFLITGNILEPGDCGIGSVDPSANSTGNCTDGSFGEIGGDARVSSYLSFLNPFVLGQRDIFGQFLTTLPTDFVSNAIPEPETWAMMLVGFGFAGSAMRRRRTSVRVTFA